MTKQIEASKVRKGMKVWLLGTVVEVTKREKWNSTKVKIHFKDCGNGLPKSGNFYARTTCEETFVNLNDLLDLAE